MGRYESCKYFESLYEATESCFPNISRQNAKTIFREVILAPDDYVVEFNDKSYDKKRLSALLAHELALSCVEETPQQTYHDIMENAAEIIKHMNDGYITDEDYEERQNFLGLLERYEFMLFAAYCFLFLSKTYEEAQINEILLNIIRLREVRDLISNYTRDEKGITTDKDEFERARPIYKMLKSLKNLGYDYNFSPKERESLNIDHEEDDDLKETFRHENWLKRIMLLQLRNEIPEEEAQTTEVSDVANAVKYGAKRLSAEEIDEKIAKLRGVYSQRRFDRNRFHMLEENNGPSDKNGTDINQEK